MSSKTSLIRVALVVTACALFLTATGMWHRSSDETAPRFGGAKTGDSGLRRNATHAPNPVYPAESLARSVTGVAVAKVTLDPNGRTTAVEILEAPDAQTGDAVRVAAKQWTYKGLGVQVTGVLIFYFHIRNGLGIVSSPQEMKNLKGLPAREDATSVTR